MKSAISIFVVLLTACAALERQDAVDRSFASVAEAEHAEYVGVDRRIAYLPPSATHIRHVHHSDSNEAWMRFSFDLRDSAIVIRDRRRLANTEASRVTLQAPAWVGDWWNDEIRQQHSTGRWAPDVYVRIVRGEAQCLAVDWSNRTAYQWTCRGHR